MMQSLDRDEVSLHVDADPMAVYALVADVSLMAQFSPEIEHCAWIDASDGPVVGARFEARNRNRRGRSWKNRPVVTVADPGREFAFARTEKMAGTVEWRYRFEAEGGGTRVTESYEVTRPITRLGWFVIERVFGDTDRRAALREGMVATLARIRDRAEADRRADGDRPQAGLETET